MPVLTPGDRAPWFTSAIAVAQASGQDVVIGGYRAVLFFLAALAILRSTGFWPTFVQLSRSSSSWAFTFLASALIRAIAI